MSSTLYSHGFFIFPLYNNPGPGNTLARISYKGSVALLTERVTYTEAAQGVIHE
jgi:hypothetical protein